MNKLMGASVAVLLILCSAVQAAAPANTTAATALKQKVTVDFVDVSLEDAVAYLRHVSGLNIVLSSREAGEKKVTLALKDVSLASALTWMTKLNGISYSVQDGIVYIGSPEEVKVGPVMVKYDVTEVLYQEKLSEAAGQEPIALDIAAPLVQPAEGKSQAELAADLIEFIKTTTGADNWEDSGKASMVYFAGKLVVNAEPELQAKVAVILAGLPG